MKTNNVIVKDSNIHGKGVFAARDFKTGEIVLRWNKPIFLSVQEINKLTDDEKQYVSYMDGKYIQMQEPEKYVNHSCDANTTAKQFCDVAKHDIKKGEEITADYKKELPLNVVIKCNCGKSNCVGTVTS